ncbi:MAG: hypothetical protein ACTSYD_13505, partial [Candidatus Heimdallarchaeaceae archaeon]
AEKRKHLYLPIIGLCIITLMLFLFLGSNTIMIYHQTVLINEKEYTAGHIQVKTYLNGLNYASELDNWTTLFSNSITSKFNESKFPATISQVDILLFVKIQVDFYFFDNKSNIVPTVANSYLVVSSGILWQKLLDLSQVNQNDMPNFITFSHNITLSEDPDIGNGFNHSFYDPFVLSSYPRLIRINKTANIHLETYKEMTDFQKQWDLPLSPGYLLFCNFSFFQELFKGEKLILEPQFERIAYVEWRGYFKTGNISLQRFEYAYYYDKLQLLIRDTISSSDLISIESPFIDDYSSSIILLNDFRYLSVIILVPLLLFGLFILFLGFQNLEEQKSSLIEWLYEKGYHFSSDLLYESIQFTIVSSFGIFFGIAFGIVFTIFDLSQLGYTLNYTFISFATYPWVLGLTLQISFLFQIITNLSVIESRRKSKDKTFHDSLQKDILSSSVMKLSSSDYITIILLLVLYPISNFFLDINLTYVSKGENLYGSSELYFQFTLNAILYAVLALFSIFTVRKIISLLFMYLDCFIRKLRNLNIATKILCYKSKTMSLAIVFMILPSVFLHFGVFVSTNTSSYLNALSAMYVGSDFKLVGLPWNNFDYKSNLYSPHIESSTIVYYSIIDDVRNFNKESFWWLRYHIIAINCSTFATTAFWDKNVVGADISLLDSLSKGKALVDIQAKEELYKVTGENITLEFQNPSNQGPVTYSYSLSIGGFVKNIPGYNNLNESDPIYEIGNLRLDLVILVSLATFQQLQDWGVMYYQFLLMKAKKNEFNAANIDLDTIIANKYPYVRKLKRIYYTNSQSIRDVPVFNNILLFVNLLSWLSTFILGLSLYLFINSIKTEITPIILRYYAKGIAKKRISIILLGISIIIGVIATIVAFSLSLLYQFLMLPLLEFFTRGIMAYSSFSFSWQELLLWAVYWIIIGTYIISFNNKIGKQKEIFLPRVVV